MLTFAGDFKTTLDRMIVMMDFFRDLLVGSATQWGGGVAHSVLVLALVIAFGILFGKIKIRGISLGVTGILFIGIAFAHFGLNVNEHLLHFIKEFGLILFVYSIGLQVGPGFFASFRKGGLQLNQIAILVVFLGVLTTIALYFITGLPITTMVGIMSGAVTNTPGLGAAQQAYGDITGSTGVDIAMGYAVAYPLGVVGAILSILLLQYILRVRTEKEEQEILAESDTHAATIRMSVEITNEALEGISVVDMHRLQPAYVYVAPNDQYLADKEFDLATFKENEPEVLLSVAIISGGVLNLSDKMTLLNEKGLELCRKTVSAEPGEAGVCLELFESELPWRFVQKFKSGVRLLAINWDDNEKKTFSFDLEKSGISKDMKATDFWSGKAVSHDGKVFEIELAPHTCQLIEFRG